MGALFSRKQKTWVPDHRKLDDLLTDEQRWKPRVDMTGWQIQNGITDRVSSQMIESKGTVEVDLSFNGLGDDEAEELARVIKQSKTIKRLILGNNHIHQKGAKAIADGMCQLPASQAPYLLWPRAINALGQSVSIVPLVDSFRSTSAHAGNRKG